MCENCQSGCMDYCDRFDLDLLKHDEAFEPVPECICPTEMD